MVCFTEHKIVMVGLDNAGKTTILYQYLMNEVVHTSPTIGSNVEEVVWKNIHFIMWDLGGQQSLRAAWSTYYSNTEVQHPCTACIVIRGPFATVWRGRDLFKSYQSINHMSRVLSYIVYFCQMLWYRQDYFCFVFTRPELHIPARTVDALTEVVSLDSYQFVQAIAIRLTTWTTYFHIQFVIHSCFIQCYGFSATENVIYWLKIKYKRILWISLLRIIINLASYCVFYTKNYHYTSPWLMFWLMFAD